MVATRGGRGGARGGRGEGRGGGRGGRGGRGGGRGGHRDRDNDRKFSKPTSKGGEVKAPESAPSAEKAEVGEKRKRAVEPDGGPNTGIRGAGVPVIQSAKKTKTDEVVAAS